MKTKLCGTLLLSLLFLTVHAVRPVERPPESNRKAVKRSFSIFKKERMGMDCDSLRLRSGETLAVRIEGSDRDFVYTSDCADPERRLNLPVASVLEIRQYRGRVISFQKRSYNLGKSHRQYRRSTQIVWWLGLIAGFALNLFGFALLFLYPPGSYSRRQLEIGLLIGLSLWLVVGVIVFINTFTLF